MVRFTNKEFDEILKLYEEFKVEVKNNSFGYVRPWDYKLFQIMDFKFSDSQFKKLIDYTFEEPIQDERILKLSILISDEDFVGKNISIKAYDYYVDKFTSTLSNLREFEEIFTDFIYFRDKMYDRWDDEKSYILEACTLKYIDRLNFVKEKHIKEVMSYLSVYKYHYRGYNGICFFNDYLKKLEESIDLDVEDFKIEDKIEDYVWKNQ